MTTIFGSGSNLIGNYVTEVAASFLFGLGYYLFKGNKQNANDSNEANKISEKDKQKFIKIRLEENLKKWENIKTIEEFNKNLQNHTDNINSQEILTAITAKGLTPNIDTFNTLLISSFFHKKFEEAFTLKNEILDHSGPVIPNSNTLNIIIKGFGLYYKHLKKYEITIEKEELIEEYDNQIEKVLKNFYERGIKPEIIALNYILEILYEQGRSEDLWDFFEKFIEKENNSEKKIFCEIPPLKIDADQHTYIILLKSVKNLFIFEEKNAKTKQNRDLNISNPINLSNLSNLFDSHKSQMWLKRFLLVAELLCKLKNFKIEEGVYDTIIELCIKFDKIDQAEFYFKNLLQEYKFNIREYSFCLMIKAYSKIYNIHRCVEIFNFLKQQKKILFENGIKKNMKIDNCSSRFSNQEEIDSIFDDSKSTISSKTTLTSFSDKFSNPNPTTVSYSSIMNACIRCNDINKCEEYVKEMEKLNIQKNAFVYSILINGYRKSKQYSKAINLFENLVNFLNMKNFAFMLTANNKKIDKNCEYVSDLNVPKKPNSFYTESIITEKENTKEKEEEKINIVLFNSILDCCIDCERFDKMAEIFDFLNEYSKKNHQNIYNISPDLITYSILMKGYAKANNVKKVLEIYEFLLKEKKDQFKLDAFSYNIILDSMARNKDCKGMIKIYTDMKNMGIETSVITFGILIKFYVNVNDLENAEELYDDLINKGLKATIVIYQLMIKLYSKNNMGYKCIDIYRNMILMGVHPDQMIYNTILRICYDNLYMKEALEILFEALNTKIILENQYYEYLIEYLVYADQFEADYEMNHFNNDRDILNLEERITGLERILYEINSLSILLSKNCIMEIQKFLMVQKNIRNCNQGKFNKFDGRKGLNINEKSNFEEERIVFDNISFNKLSNSSFNISKDKIDILNKGKLTNNKFIDEDNISTISKNFIQKNQINDFNYECELDLQSNNKSFYNEENKTNKYNNNNYQNINKYNNNQKGAYKKNNNTNILKKGTPKNYNQNDNYFYKNQCNNNNTIYNNLYRNNGKVFYSNKEQSLYDL